MKTRMLARCTEHGGVVDPDRRRMLRGAMTLTGALLAVVPGSRLLGAERAPVAGVSIEEFSPAGKSLGVRQMSKVVRSDDEWQRQLSREAYYVTRHAGTEPSYSGALWNQQDSGLYRCVCCDTALFDSATKFESGTGWPSFWNRISKYNVTQLADSSLWMTRTAVSCRLCEAHLGHVFDDGPNPTGLRYCMNSAALKFYGRQQG